jgi:hypothetical protein
VCCLLVLNLVSSTPPCIRQPGLRIRVLGVCDRVQVCTQAFVSFLAFELLVNNASSDTLAFSLRLVSSLPAADAPATRAGFSAAPPLAPSPFHGSSSFTLPPHLDLLQLSCEPLGHLGVY